MRSTRCPVCGVSYTLEQLPLNLRSQLENRGAEDQTLECSRCSALLLATLSSEGELTLDAPSLQAAQTNPFLQTEGWFQSARNLLPQVNPSLFHSPLWQEMRQLLRWFQQIGQEAQRIEQEMLEMENHSLQEPK